MITDQGSNIIPDVLIKIEDLIKLKDEYCIPVTTLNKLDKNIKDLILSKIDFNSKIIILSNYDN